jgi:hypothetical protein
MYLQQKCCRTNLIDGLDPLLDHEHEQGVSIKNVWIQLLTAYYLLPIQADMKPLDLMPQITPRQTPGASLCKCVSWSEPQRGCLASGSGVSLHSPFRFRDAASSPLATASPPSALPQPLKRPRNFGSP